MTEFDPFEMCRILNSEGVDYVVLGGFAANLRGSPIMTRDLDVIPDRERDNLDRLGRALNRMNAKIRISGDPVETKIDGGFLANIGQPALHMADVSTTSTFSPLKP